MNARGTFTKVVQRGRQVGDASPLRRFIRWGLVRGPLWGIVAVAVTLPVAAVMDYSGSTTTLAVVALLGGILGGPLIGAVAGAACTVADRAPKWFIDAPDYVAVLAVIGTVAAVAWPLLGLGNGSVTLGVSTVLALGVAPAVDAAAHAPGLLHPDQSGSNPPR